MAQHHHRHLRGQRARGQRADGIRDGWDGGERRRGNHQASRPSCFGCCSGCVAALAGGSSARRRRVPQVAAIQACAREAPQLSRRPTWPSTGSSCCRVEMTNTAVLPMPDLAWQMTSMPRMACGMHSCCTAQEGRRRGGAGGRMGGRARRLKKPTLACRLVVQEGRDSGDGRAAEAPGTVFPRRCHSCGRGSTHARRRTFRWVLKAAVLDGTQQLGLQQEVLKAAAVDAHIALLDLRRDKGSSGGVAARRPEAAGAERWGPQPPPGARQRPLQLPDSRAHAWPASRKPDCRRPHEPRHLTAPSAAFPASAAWASSSASS